MVRAGLIEGDVGQAVIHGRRAVELAQATDGELLVPALGSLARALYFAGAVDEACSSALRAIEQPGVEQRPPGHALARAMLALAALARGQTETARTHAETARTILADFGGRSWLGANAAAAWGLMHAEEGKLSEAERELSYAERLFRDEITTVDHTWTLVLLARVRCSRGRLEGAEDALRSARAGLSDFTDSGIVAQLADEVTQDLREAQARAHHGELLEPPSRAELAVLRLLGTELSAREISDVLFLSPNTVRSHTRAIYRKLGVNSRRDAVARAEMLGLLWETESPM
jgi:LuxR family maltose regulon positive regulatory protein